MRNGWRRSKNEESTSRFFIAKFQLHNNLIAVAGDKQGLWVVFLGSGWTHKNTAHSHLAIACYGDWAERSVDTK